MLVVLQLSANRLSCSLHKDAFSSSFKSILRAGDFKIEETRVRRSDDSGVVDDMPPEAPSPSSTISSESSSSNLSTGLTTDPSKPTATVDSALEKRSRNVSGDETQPADDGKSSGDKSGAVNTCVKSSVISTPLNVVESSAASTPMSLAITSGTRPQLTRNIVVVVKSTSSAVTQNDDKRSAVGQNVVHASEQTEKPKNRSPRNATLTLTSTSVRGPTPVQGAPAPVDIVCPLKSVAEGTNRMRRQQSVDADRRVTKNTTLRRMESSPCSLTAATAAVVNPAAKETTPQICLPVSNCRVKCVVPRSQPAVIKLSPIPSSPLTSSSEHVTTVPSMTSTGTSETGQSSHLTIYNPEQGKRVPSPCIPDKAVVVGRQRHRSTPVESPPARNTSSPATSNCNRKQAVISSDNSKCDKPNRETSELETNLTEGERVSQISPATQCQILSNSPQSVGQIHLSTPNTDTPKNVVIGRIRKISTPDQNMTPVTSRCLVSAKQLSRKPTLTGIASRIPQSKPQSDQHTGPVISDVFESLRRRQQQESAAAAAAVLQDAKIAAAVAPRLSKARQRPTRSARSKSGRSSVVSVTARTKHPPSRQPSAARYRKPKTPSSTVCSTVGVSAKNARSTRSRKDCASRGQRKRSQSSTRKEEIDIEPEVETGTSHVTLIGRTGQHTATTCEEGSGVHVVVKHRYEPSKNDKTEETNTSERYKSTRRSRMTHSRTKSFEMPSVLPDQVCDPAGTRNDAFTCGVNVSKANVAAVDKHKRSTSFNDAERRDSVLAYEVLKDQDQQGNCKHPVSEPTGRPSPEDGNLSRRLSTRRKSQSADPLCHGDDAVAPDAGAEEIQLCTAAAAAAAEPKSHSLSRQTGKLPICSSELDSNQDAELTAAIDEIMRSRPSSRTSRRRSRPAHRGADAVVEHDVSEQVIHVYDNPSSVVRAPYNISPVCEDQEINRKASIVSTTSDVGNEAVLDRTSADEDRDGGRSPLFVRKHDSVVAMSSDDSRRPSVEKMQCGLTTTFDADATLSWHSFFDNSGTGNDMVSKLCYRIC